MDKSSISISIENPEGEIKVGSPFVIKNVQELKIIYQVFNPNSNIQVSSDTEKIVRLPSKFIPKTFRIPYNWKFYDTKDKPSMKEKVLNSMVKGTNRKFKRSNIFSGTKINNHNHNINWRIHLSR